MTDKPTYTKDPDDTLPYTVDFADFLGGFTPAAEIDSHQVVAEAGITVEASSNTTTAITAALSGGTAGQAYDVTFRATLDQGPPYSKDQTIRLVIREQ